MAEKTEIMTEVGLKQQAMVLLSEAMDGRHFPDHCIEVAQKVLSILKDEFVPQPYRYAAPPGSEAGMRVTQLGLRKERETAEEEG